MNKYDDISQELQLQPVILQANCSKCENRLKELQDGLNIIKQYLDDYANLKRRRDKLLSQTSPLQRQIKIKVI